MNILNTNSKNGYPSTFDGLLKLVEKLRGPDGCPWDQKQTRETFRNQFLEEAYELIDGLDNANNESICEESGDVLLHIAFQIQLAKETNSFSATQVFKNIIDKLINRHPHVFKGVKIEGENQLLKNWDEIKKTEKAHSNYKSILDGMPKAMSSLSISQKMQKRVERVNFDWEDLDGVLNKISEEISEFNKSETDADKEHELGDILFSIVNLCRWNNVDAESALRKSYKRFEKRFKFIEESCEKKGRSVDELTLSEQNDLWAKAKTENN
ncbi:MAG: tetrapyrrole methylase family protein / MazG family protein [Chloroflexi bacterium]|jgi:tetrapyrrole methylase family protein/MazG family protein|nr:MAG: tetrapyrrole methylase family protein / MazG family protein [Chloroflexota bacterium]